MKYYTFFLILLIFCSNQLFCTIIPFSFSNDSLLKPINDLKPKKLSLESRIDSIRSLQIEVNTDINFEGYNIPLYKNEIVSIKDTVGDKHIIRYKIELKDYNSCGFIISFESFDKDDIISFYDNNEQLIHNSLGYKSIRWNKKLLVPVSNNKNVIIEYCRDINASLNEMSIDKIIINPYDNSNALENNLKTSYGASNNCNIDVNCIQGNSLCKEKNSIVKISVDAGSLTYSCSGSLVNNTRQDFTPYILSAFHCFDTHGSTDYNLSSQEKLYMQFYTTFEFFYWNNNCGSNQTQSTELYNGAQFKSGWHDYTYGTDFVLMELLDPIKFGNQSIEKAYFSGWDRALDNMNTTNFLHHPRGDVMKITGSTSLPSVFNDYQYVIDPNSGIIETGSSGSPLYNSQNLVIGIQSSSSPYVGACSNQDRVHVGRISRAWDGNGSLETRLKDYLDPINSGVMSLTGIYKDEHLEFGLTASSGQNWHKKAYSNYTVGGDQIGPYRVENGAELKLQGGKEVRILPCTHIKNGSEFRAFIEKPDCDDIVLLSDNWSEHNANVCAGYPKLGINIEDNIQPVQPNPITISPNPASQSIEVTFGGLIEGAEVTAYIVDIMGRRLADIYNGLQSRSTTLSQQVDISRYPAGTYSIVLQTGKHTYSEQFVKLD